LKKYVIIVAGGSGIRMDSKIPKQFIPVSKKPVLMHSIECFYNYSVKITIILVLPKIYFDLWKTLCKKNNFTIKHKIIEGGKTRFHSVKNGLSVINEESLVAIHDGVRPLVSNETISRAFHYAKIFGNGIPVVPINESVREIYEKDNKPIERKKLCIVQTPQCFKSSIIKKAYKQNYQENFTDDATVIESTGEKIQLFNGNIENIKITRPIDLKIAEIILKKTGLE